MLRTEDSSLPVSLICPIRIKMVANNAHQPTFPAIY
jgi:hypothetical protein